MALPYTPAIKGQSRVWLTENGAKADNQPIYESCMRGGALSQSFGDVTRGECPDPDAYGQYVEVLTFKGSSERPSSDLMRKFPLDKESILLRIGRKRCKFSCQYHFGDCKNPSEYYGFKKNMIWEDCDMGSISSDELGSLASTDEGEINMTAPFTAREVYEALPITFVEKAADEVVNPVLDVVICSSPSCGDCADEDDGCEVIYAVDDGLTGSPGTQPDLLYSTDKGLTWATENINSMGDGDTPAGIACIGSYVVVADNSNDALQYKEKTNIGTVGGWTQITTGFIAAGSPNDIWGTGSYIFVVGDGGYIYGSSDPTTGVTVLDAGVAAAAANLNAVHAPSNSLVVAVGDTDTVVYSTNGSTFAIATAPGGGNNLISVWVINELEWWAGDDAGQLWFTVDGGVTWTERVLPGTLWTAINDIQFPKKSVGYIAADKDATPKGFVLQTFSAGESWIALPQNGTTFPANDSLVALATCEYDVNFVVAVGTHDNATDGIIFVGQD